MTDTYAQQAHARPDIVARRARSRAQHAALSRLVSAHRPQFNQLYATAKADDPTLAAKDCYSAARRALAAAHHDEYTRYYQSELKARGLKSRRAAQ